MNWPDIKRFLTAAAFFGVWIATILVALKVIIVWYG